MTMIGSLSDIIDGFDACAIGAGNNRMPQATAIQITALKEAQSLNHDDIVANLTNPGRMSKPIRYLAVTFLGAQNNCVTN